MRYSCCCGKMITERKLTIQIFYIILTPNAELNKMYMITLKCLLRSFYNYPFKPYSHTNITFYASSPWSALIRVSGHGLVVALHIRVANLACGYFSIIRTYCMARSSLSNFSPTYTRETCQRHMVGSCSLLLHPTPTLRNDAAISLLHLYA